MEINIKFSSLYKFYQNTYLADFAFVHSRKVDVLYSIVSKIH